MRSTLPAPTSGNDAIDWPEFGQVGTDSAGKPAKVVPTPAAPLSAKQLRIRGRVGVRLAREQTRQQKVAAGAQKDQNRTETTQKRAETAASVQISKQQLRGEEAWARADLERARAERKQAEASKLRATASNVQLGLKLLAGLAAVGAVVWAVVRVRGLLRLLPLLALLVLGTSCAGSRERWRKSPNGRLHAVTQKKPPHRRIP